jgi:hypothetical protein
MKRSTNPRDLLKRKVCVNNDDSSRDIDSDSSCEVMQEHHQHQVSMGESTTHFEHMLNCLKTFEERMRQT